MHQTNQRWWLLGTAGVAQLMVVLDATVITIALPSAQQVLGMSDSSRGWVVTAYALAFGGLLLIGGRLSDALGARRAFVAGLFGFAVTSALAGAAPNTALLVAGRAGQGVFAALLAPAALSLVSMTFTEIRERATAFGIFGALTGVGAVVGLLLGGTLTQFLGWRWCLLINVPIAALALIGVALFVGETPRRPASIDVTGAITSVIGMTGVVFALAEASSRGWTDPLVALALVTGLTSLGVFVRSQRRSANPLLPLRVVLDRSRGGAFLAIGLPQLALFGFFLVLTYWFQQLLGYTPLEAGLAFLPLAFGIGLGSTVIAGTLVPRLSPRAVIVPALIVMALGTLLLVGIEPGTSAVYLTRFLPAELLIGLGLGCTIAPSVAIATAGIDEGETGIASAVVNAATQLGGSMGTALLNTVAATFTAASLRASTSEGRGTTDAVVDATVAGFDAALLTGSGLLAITALLVGLIIPAAARTASTELPKHHS